jgi:hypothetical protein
MMTDSQESGQGTNVEEANFDFTPDQKRALLAILQVSGSSDSHHLNHVKTKVNHSKHATSKSGNQTRKIKVLVVLCHLFITGQGGL